MENVDNFIYLGVNFTSDGTLTSAVRQFNDQALNVYNILFGVFDRVALDFNLNYQFLIHSLFQSYYMDIRSGLSKIRKLLTKIIYVSVAIY